MQSGSWPSLREAALFAEAAMTLSLASFAVRYWPFRWIVRSTAFGSKEGGHADPPAISLAVRRASRRLPWRTVCFQEGLAVHWMLRRRGTPSYLHYGLRSEERLSAHVWVTLHDLAVIGEEQRDPHICVATFPRLDGGPGAA